MNKQQLANKIWASANKMRSKIEANEYKDYILGLIFYKFLSDNEVNYLKSIGWTDEDIVTLVENHEDQEAVMMMEYCRNNIGYFIEYKNLFGTWLKPNSEFSVADLSGALNSFDGLLNYYKGRNEVCDLEIEKAFMEHVGWNELLPKPYFIDADKTLFEHFSDVTREGITIAAPGFYAPQGRWVRLEPQDAELNAKIESFGYHGRRITNFEMEGSALAGLAALMGHRAATICTIIAQRIAQNVDTDYKPFVRKMISTALDKLAVLK